MRSQRWLYAPGAGFLLALVLLGVVEAALHADGFLRTYRSVFAVGRAEDKLRYVEAQAPALLIMGNSRVDNAFDPKTVQRYLPWASQRGAFNLGMPGADARILYGVAVRLSQEGLLAPHRIGHVVIGLDEGLLQDADGLGYGVFFADRRSLLQRREFVDLLRSWVRLWGFSENLKELREPAKLEQFIAASFNDVDPIGGAAGSGLGYRAGFGGLQGAAEALAQEAGSKDPPSERQLDYFRRMLDLLRSKQVEVAIVFPPLLNRSVLYCTPGDPAAAPYLEVVADLQARRVPLIRLEQTVPGNPEEFVNAGHLNDRGAQRYSRILAEKLVGIWPGSGAGGDQ